MGAIYSTQMFLGLQPAGTTTAFEVPAGFVYVVTDIEVGPTEVGLQGAQFLINEVIVIGLGLDPGQPGVVSPQAQWRGRMVMNPGDVMTVANGDPVGVIISGYRLVA